MFASSGNCPLCKSGGALFADNKPRESLLVNCKKCKEYMITYVLHDQIAGSEISQDILDTLSVNVMEYFKTFNEPYLLSEDNYPAAATKSGLRKGE